MSNEGQLMIAQLVVVVVVVFIQRSAKLAWGEVGTAAK